MRRLVAFFDIKFAHKCDMGQAERNVTGTDFSTKKGIAFQHKCCWKERMRRQTRWVLMSYNTNLYFVSAACPTLLSCFSVICLWHIEIFSLRFTTWSNLKCVQPLTCMARSRSSLVTCWLAPSKFRTRSPAKLLSLGVSKVYATPFSPARPVRPILWVWVSISRATS